jgi:hypothetical protein
MWTNPYPPLVCLEAVDLASRVESVLEFARKRLDESARWELVAILWRSDILVAVKSGPKEIV